MARVPQAYFGRRPPPVYHRPPPPPVYRPPPPPMFRPPPIIVNSGGGGSGIGGFFLFIVTLMFLGAAGFMLYVVANPDSPAAKRAEKLLEELIDKIGEYAPAVEPGGASSSPPPTGSTPGPSTPPPSGGGDEAPPGGDGGGKSPGQILLYVFLGLVGLYFGVGLLSILVSGIRSLFSSGPGENGEPGRLEDIPPAAPGSGVRGALPAPSDGERPNVDELSEMFGNMSLYDKAAAKRLKGMGLEPVPVTVPRQGKLFIMKRAAPPPRAETGEEQKMFENEQAELVGLIQKWKTILENAGWRSRAGVAKNDALEEAKEAVDDKAYAMIQSKVLWGGDKSWEKLRKAQPWIEKSAKKLVDLLVKDPEARFKPPAPGAAEYGKFHNWERV